MNSASGSQVPPPTGRGIPPWRPAICAAVRRSSDDPACPPSSQDVSQMQPEIDAQLSNFFEDAPARDFAKVMRGYDQHQVDEYLKQLDAEMRQHRDQVQALQQELSDAHRQIREQERPTYSGLGSRIEQLLRLAEEPAPGIGGAAEAAAG